MSDAMNRFFRFFKKLFTPPKLSHDASRVAKKRIEIASKISDDQIYVQTVRNALRVPEATISDKLTFAFSSLPETPTDFPYAKDMFFDILEFLHANEEVSSEDIELFKKCLKGIKTFEELMAACTEFPT